MQPRSFQTTGIVLKRKNIGETDRIVHILTPTHGKIVCVAKGARKLKSSKLSLLEPGNHIKIFLHRTKSLPILTQALIIQSCQAMPQTLAKLRQLSQLIELFDVLFVEEELEPSLFELVLRLRQAVVIPTKPPTSFKNDLRQLIIKLGYQDPTQSNHKNITSYVEELLERKLKSFEYLRVDTKF